MKRSFLALTGLSRRGFFLPALLLALTALSSSAQEPVRAPDGGTSTHVDGVDLLAIPGVPLTGASNIWWSRSLADGSTLTWHLQAPLARDSQGRMYRERRSFAPADADPSRTSVNFLLILDPVAKSRTECNTHTKECVITDYFARTEFKLQREGPIGNARFLSRESLGADKLEGFEVAGTRETLTTNAGVVGNDRPLAATREFWYSADLKTNVKVTRDDPAFGRQVVWLSNVNLGEPNPELFQVPKGYVVRDARFKTQALR